MFPYKIRTPAWGSLKPKPKPTKRNRRAPPAVFDAESHLGGDPDDAHTVGGNLQRAILLDLIELRRRYSGFEASASSSDAHAAGTSTNTATASATSSQSIGSSARNNEASAHPTGTNSRHHAALGSSFSRFRACFREARFGAIHTRAVPPRVDRGEYVQLLYSSCFYLLEESFNRSTPGEAEFLCWDEDSHPNSGFNAIYAVFTLYALRQTDVLPEAPPPRSRSKRARSGRFDERSLREAWSMLPIGINTDDDKLYRRTFRSGVRVDRRNYIMLLRLRDLCLARAGRCAVDETDSATAASASPSCVDASWRCRCGLTRDAAHVIDKMLFDDAFFDYCEYHGPHSLEGLAGSAQFYRAHFANRSKRNRRLKKNAHVAPRGPAALTKLELNAMGNEDRIRDSSGLRNLSDLVESHRSNLASVVSQVQRSRVLGSDLQPKQRELVENTLGGMMEQSGKYLKVVHELNTERGSKNVDASKKESKPPSEVQHVEYKHGLSLSFPETFSPALCDKIRGVLFDFEKEVDTIRKAVIKENNGRMKEEVIQNSSDMHHELACFNDLETVATEQQLRSGKILRGNDIVSTAPDRLRRKRRLKFDTFFDLQQMGMNDDDQSSNTSRSDEEISITTGAGRNALLSLLSMAEGRDSDSEPINAFENDDEVSIATGAGKNALMSLLAMAKVRDREDEPTNAFQKDEVSVATGAGKNAIMSLLSMAEGDNLPDYLEDGVGSIDESFMSNVITSTPYDDASVASGMGKRALKLLLAQSTDRKKSKHGAKPVKKSGERKKPRQKLSTGATAANAKAQKNNAEAKSSKKKDDCPETSMQTTQPTVVSTKQTQDVGDIQDVHEISVNASAVTGMEEEFSIAAEGAGKSALASLLSLANGGEYV